MENLKVECLTLGVCQTNCYYRHREDSREVIFFDPADKGSFLYETLQEYYEPLVFECEEISKVIVEF